MKTGRSILLLIVFVLISGQIRCLASGSGPVITYTVNLTESMKTALEAFDPDFRIWEQADFAPEMLDHAYEFSLKQFPSAVIGDFNNDGIIDVVLFGCDKTESRILAVLSDDETFKVIEVKNYGKTEAQMRCINGDSNDCKLVTYLTYSGPGRYESPHEKNALDLATDAFVITYYEAAAELIYFREDKFHEYRTAD
ncbi:MAG TPA: hypothetical protein PLN69_05125 [bacterium]|nr:hypothetical protein [bacterium]